MVPRLCLVGLLLLSLVGVLACQNNEPVPAGSFPSHSSGTLKIGVDRSGIYRLTTDRLTVTGMPAWAVDPTHISLTHGKQVVPFWISDSTLYFYGLAPEGRYSSVAYYLLRWSEDVSGGPLMEPVPLLAETVSGDGQTPLRSLHHLEENTVYLSRAAPSVREPWFWGRLGPGLELESRFQLPYTPDSGEAALRVLLWGATSSSDLNPDHLVAVSLNGYDLGEIEWDGETSTSAELLIPSGLLTDTNNRLLINRPESALNPYDLSYLDRVEINYPVQPEPKNGILSLVDVTGNMTLSDVSLMFDVTDPHAPFVYDLGPDAGRELEITLSGSRSLVALSRDGGLEPQRIVPLGQSDWSASSHQADYLIITSADFVAAVEPLALARRAKGLSVEIIPLEEIYDEFGFGEETPLAIRAFLRHASQEWAAPSPRYLLLVGDATYDFRGYLEPSPQYHVPPILVSVTHSGETISDSRLVELDGDGQPDLAVGRWPVSSEREVESLVERTLTYQDGTSVHSGSLFVADESDSAFTAMSERLIQESNLKENSRVLVGPSAEDVLQAWNQGAWLINYAGHGSLDIWGKNESLSAEALEGLLPGVRPPIVVQLTCLTGYFAHPTQPSLAEEMLWHENGPVTVIAATSLTLSSHQEPFATALLAAFADPTVLTVGEALLHAQNSVEPGNAGMQEIVDTFVLLGDPAVSVGRPDPVRYD
jgi:hypothetical protein